MLKSFIICIFIIVFLCINLFPSMAMTKISCIHDYSHDYTQPLNAYFSSNTGARKTLMIIGGAISDLIFLTMLGLWTYKGTTWRFPLALVLVYLAKMMTSFLFRIRYPDNSLWEYPGFFSLTTPYGMANDSHFTVHVSLVYVVFLELMRNKYKVLAPFAFFIFMYQSFLVIITRGAYIIDVFAAIIFGHAFFIIAEYLAYYIDVSIFGLTFQERFPNFDTECSNCSFPIN